MFKETINKLIWLRPLKIVVNELGRLNHYNRRRDFLDFREQNLQSTIALVARIGIFSIVAFHIIDVIFGVNNRIELKFLELFEAVFLIINYYILKSYKSITIKKNHIIGIFYQLVIYSTLFSYYSANLKTFLGIGLIVTIFVWFAFIPFEFNRLHRHGIFFLGIYIGTLYILRPELLINISSNILYILVIYAIGSAAAYSSNRTAIMMFTYKQSFEKAESAQIEQEKKYQTFVERANDGIVILQNGILVFINKKMADILGYNLDDIVGKPFIDFIHPNYRKQVYEYYTRRQAGEEMPSIYESALLTRQGILLPVEFNAVIINYNNEVATLTQIRDITERKKAEKALAESEARFVSFMNNIPAVAFIKDENDKYLFVNDYMKVLTGIEQIEGRTFEELLETGEIPHYTILTQKEIPGKNVVISEDEYTDKTGAKSIFQTYSFPIKNSTGGVLTGVISLDISEQKRADELIKENENKYKSIFDAAGDAIFLINVDSGEILDANDSALKLYGYDRDEMLSLTIDDISAEKVEPINSEGANITYSIPESFHRKKDGSLFNVEITGGIFHRHDRQLAIAIVHDISERKAAEEALRKNNERLTLHILHTPLAYIEWDEKFDIVEWNPTAERLFGFTKDEAIGKPFDIIVPDDITDEIRRLLEKMIQQSTGTRNTNKNCTKDGRIIHCEWYNTPLKDKNGNVIGLASLVQDITERKRLEAQLEKTIFALEKDYSKTVEQMQTYFTELQINKNELLKLQKENLQSQFDTLKNQVNPHFLFNSLNVLISLIKLDPDLAEKFTEHMAKIYRYVLEHKSGDLVELGSEIDFVRAYAFLLNIRFKDKIDFCVDVGDEFLAMKIPPLTLQILIENCIKHNTFSKKSPLRICITIVEKGYIVVENNFQVRPTKIESTGIGQTNIANRYKYFTDKPATFGKVGDKYVSRIPLL